MSSYIIRKIDPALWQRVKARAEAEQLPLRQLILRLLRGYADRHIHITATDGHDMQVAENTADTGP